jgi:hypothetical protein
VSNANLNVVCATAAQEPCQCYNGTPPDKVPSQPLLSPSYSILTDGAGAVPSTTNLIGATPGFLDDLPRYLQVYQATSKGAGFGGNFVVATFTPNGLFGNYHIANSSPAVAHGSTLSLGTPGDFDHRCRVSPVDIGAHQVVAAAGVCP